MLHRKSRGSLLLLPLLSALPPQAALAVQPCTYAVPVGESLAPFWIAQHAKQANRMADRFKHKNQLLTQLIFREWTHRQSSWMQLIPLLP